MEYSSTSIIYLNNKKFLTCMSPCTITVDMFCTLETGSLEQTTIAKFPTKNNVKATQQGRAPE